MDCLKIGNLIAQLRKEKGLSQQRLADMLNISNKTVSKWECGNGVPDASVWEELSAILSADVIKLLKGELAPNPKDKGKIDKINFYVCSECGNMLTSTGKASVSCCGRSLYPIKASACNEEHRISVKEAETEYYAEFDHEMSKSHYISFAAYVYYDFVYIRKLYPEGESGIRLPLVKRDGTLYLYCNRHGLLRYTDITSTK